MFIAAFVLVWLFDQDLLARLIDTYNSHDGISQAQASPIISMVISASILAGGSAGISNVMVALGFRSPPESDTEQKPPGPDHAWLSIRVKGLKKGANQS